MDIDELISQLRVTSISESIQVCLDTIITSIKETAESGSNILVYELLILTTNEIQGIRNELLTLFPDMDITIIEKRLIIDWS